MTATKSREEILSSLSWSAPREVSTKRGPKMVSSADANQEVFDLMATAKDEMYKLGYSVSQFRGKWQISKWSDPDKEVVAKREEAKALSRATDAELSVPSPEGLTYLGYQRAGIKFSLDRPAVLIGDEMGLGKTIQAIGIINSLPESKMILVVCPASLKLNWERELNKWLVVPREIRILSSEDRMPKEPCIIILNYDILHRFSSELRSTQWDILICDEAHYLKTPDSRRTQMVFGRKAKKATATRKAVEPIAPISAKKRILLTGTPIANRPIEIFPLLEYLDPVGWNNFFKYAMRYCNAHSNGFGWDFSGQSNLDELQEKLRTSILVRRLKKDVLTELPAKRRQVIEFPAEGKLAQFAEAEKRAYEDREDEINDLRAQVELAKASDNPDDYPAAVKRLKDGLSAVFAAISSQRRELAEAKIPLMLDFLKEALEEGDKIVFFAHHKAVIQETATAFGKIAVKLDGSTSMEDRQLAVDRFQNDPNVKLFIGSTLAAGVGLTLTAASHVVFGELDWVPGNVSQAEDRCHRIGQRESVLVQHLVVQGSLDATMAKKIVAKQEVIDAALDKISISVGLTPEEKKDRGGATVEVTVDKLAEMAAQMTQDQRLAVHQGLKILSARDDDHASYDNGIGFSGLDTRIGNDLAARPFLSPKQAALGRKILTRYKNTQLPPELVKRMGLEVKS